MLEDCSTRFNSSAVDDSKAQKQQISKRLFVNSCPSPLVAATYENRDGEDTTRYEKKDGLVQNAGGAWKHSPGDISKVFN